MRRKACASVGSARARGATLRLERITWHIAQRENASLCELRTMIAFRSQLLGGVRVTSSSSSTHLAGSSTELLLVAVAEGSTVAFEALYHQTSRKLFGICLRVLADRAEAEEVLQEVFTTVWQKARQFEAGRASAIGWLAMITRNRAIDRLRTLPARESMATIDLAQQIEDPRRPLIDEAQSLADRDRLEGCIHELDWRQRALIRAAFFEGSTYEELATRIGSPLGSVKSWIRRGLMQLRTCLERTAVSLDEQQ
jgi:RNA polymerase sigma-70 factor, ECF subfamily